jgi:NDP-sugar pyrophosphorylase family protein
LAGGKATRLYPLTKTIPKSMVEICSKPFFYYQIKLLLNDNIKNIVMCVGTFHQQIINFFGDGREFGTYIQYSIEDPEKLLGTAGALKNAEKYLEDVFFVMYGDSYLPINFMKVYNEFQNHNKLGLMTIYKNNNKFDKSNISKLNDLIITYDKTGMGENLEYIDYGLLILRKETLQMIPPNEFVDLGFLIKKLIDMKELIAYEVHDRFYEIGSVSGIADFEAYAKTNL